MNIRLITVSCNNHIERFTTHSVDETNTLACRIAKTLRGGDVLALTGELGAGKTTFVQGLARALGIKVQITSPTFVLMKIYKLPKRINGIAELCHIDAYRLDSTDDLAAIGAGEYSGDAKTMTVIEWPERVSEFIPKKATSISFDHDPD